MNAQELLDAVVSKIAMPTLLELEQETKQSIRAKVSAMFTGVVAIREICTRATDSDNGALGEVKVLLKEGALPGVFNYSVECVLEGIAPGTGFSGFVMRGKLIVSDNETSIKIAARTNRYNVWTWGKDFSF